MPSLTRPLTIASIDRLPAAQPGERLWVRDGRTTGLALRVTDRGAKSWYINRRMDGSPQKYLIGAYPEMSPDAAKAEAVRLLAKIEDGANPQAERNRRRDQPTFAEVFADWMTNDAKGRKRSWQDDQRFFDGSKDGGTVYIPAEWKNRPLGRIVTEDIARNHAKIGAESPYMANRLRAMLHTVFQYAIDGGKYDGPNPVTKKGVRKFPEEARERALTADEVRRLAVVLADHPREVARDALTMLLLTGARKQEVLDAKWEEFDLDQMVWTLPAARCKGKRTERKVLDANVVELLRRREASAAAGVEWVFPACRARRGMADDPNPEAIGPCVIPHREWKAICKAAGIKGARIHDLRRTWGSWAAEGGESIYIVQRILGHRNIVTTERYARLRLDPLRKSVTNTAGRLVAAMNADAVPMLTA